MSASRMRVMPLSDGHKEVKKRIGKQSQPSWSNVYVSNRYRVMLSLTEHSLQLHGQNKIYFAARFKLAITDVVVNTLTYLATSAGSSSFTPLIIHLMHLIHRTYNALR